MTKPTKILIDKKGANIHVKCFPRSIPSAIIRVNGPIKGPPEHSDIYLVYRNGMAGGDRIQSGIETQYRVGEEEALKLAHSYAVGIAQKLSTRHSCPIADLTDIES
jgi:hypothetical protein